jgi:hypothetical protein
MAQPDEPQGTGALLEALAGQVELALELIGSADVLTRLDELEAATRDAMTLVRELRRQAEVSST